MEQVSILLQIIASTAIGLAGFSGVVVALTGKPTEQFNQRERFNLLVLLRLSALALVFAMVPLILSSALNLDAAWQVSMLMYGGTHLFDLVYWVRKVWKLEKKSRSYLPSLIVGASIAIYQIIVGLFGSSVLVEVSYLCVLVWHLAIAAMNFADLLFAAQGKK